jgi:hypothetical protein
MRKYSSHLGVWVLLLVHSRGELQAATDIVLKQGERYSVEGRLGWVEVGNQAIPVLKKLVGSYRTMHNGNLDDVRFLSLRAVAGHDLLHTARLISDGQNVTIQGVFRWTGTIVGLSNELAVESMSLRGLAVPTGLPTLDRLHTMAKAAVNKHILEPNTYRVGPLVSTYIFALQFRVSGSRTLTLPSPDPYPFTYTYDVLTQEVSEGRHSGR